jgi:hypothetical protein
MLLYVEDWLPFLSVALIAAIVCCVASLIIEQIEP